MSKYYRIHCFTPYCGEDNYFYICSDDYAEVERYAEDCAYDNGSEWWDEESTADWVENGDEFDAQSLYYEECGYDIEEIDLETWLKEADIV